MLVVFRSRATESITMFEGAAVELLKLMGATGRIPGGFSAEDVPPALARLEAAVERIKKDAHAPTPARRAKDEGRAADENEEADRQPPVAITTRAIPLLGLLKRAAAANAEVTWEGMK